MNNRRKFIVALGAGALAAPFHAFAQQQGKVWRVGVLSIGSPPVLETVGGITDASLPFGY